MLFKMTTLECQSPCNLGLFNLIVKIVNNFFCFWSHRLHSHIAKRDFRTGKSRFGYQNHENFKITECSLLTTALFLVQK